MDPNGPAVGTHLVCGAAHALFERYKDCPLEFTRGRERFKQSKKQRKALQQLQTTQQQQVPMVALPPNECLPPQCVPVAPTMPVMGPPQHTMLYMPHHIPQHHHHIAHQHNQHVPQHVPLPPMDVSLEVGDGDGFEWLLEGLDDLTADIPTCVMDAWGNAGHGADWASQPTLEVGGIDITTKSTKRGRGRSKKSA